MTVFLEEPVDEKEQAEAAQKKTEDALGSYDLFDKEVNLKYIFAKNPFDPQHPLKGSIPAFVQKVDNSIRGINLYPLDSAILFVSLILIHWIVIYLVDNTIHLYNNRGLVCLFIPDRGFYAE